MSTPVVAGAVALVRQYFTEGWYPSGTKTPSSAYTPSGALLKAVVLGMQSEQPPTILPFWSHTAWHCGSDSFTVRRCLLQCVAWICLSLVAADVASQGFKHACRGAVNGEYLPYVLRPSRVS